MAGYTIKNLKSDVEDMAPKFDMSPGLEGRFARDELDAEQSGISYQRLAAGFRMPFGHRHKEEEELYVVVGGHGRIKLDDEILELKQWDTVRIAPETMRCLEGGPEGVEVIAFGARGLGNDDVDMIPGWWAD
jgi:mannose-6-phosphate isomerase-like protein (cupin superfamily)